jgi:hypothetical protein
LCTILSHFSKCLRTATLAGDGRRRTRAVAVCGADSVAVASGGNFGRGGMCGGRSRRSRAQRLHSARAGCRSYTRRAAPQDLFWALRQAQNRRPLHSGMAAGVCHRGTAWAQRWHRTHSGCRARCLAFADSILQWSFQPPSPHPADAANPTMHSTR